ncbi:hypothetical protein IWQ57_006841, partial [Coemansia nantahalensis]
RAAGGCGRKHGAWADGAGVPAGRVPAVQLEGLGRPQPHRVGRAAVRPAPHRRAAGAGRAAVPRLRPGIPARVLRGAGRRRRQRRRKRSVGTVAAAPRAAAPDRCGAARQGLAERQPGRWVGGRGARTLRAAGGRGGRRAAGRPGGRRRTGVWRSDQRDPAVFAAAGLCRRGRAAGAVGARGARAAGAATAARRPARAPVQRRRQQRRQVGAASVSGQRGGACHRDRLAGRQRCAGARDGGAGGVRGTEHPRHLCVYADVGCPARGRPGGRRAAARATPWPAVRHPAGRPGPHRRRPEPPVHRAPRRAACRGPGRTVECRRPAAPCAHRHRCVPACRLARRRLRA